MRDSLSDFGYFHRSMGCEQEFKSSPLHMGSDHGMDYFQDYFLGIALSGTWRLTANLHFIRS